MPQFILDIITARGWSIRYLAELTGLSYSGIRDYLHGQPNRLSQQRVLRIYDMLDLDLTSGLLKPDAVYAWRIEHDTNTLAALNRVLRVMLEVEPYPASSLEENRHDTAFKFAAIPLIGGGVDVLPAPYCVLYWREVTLLIQWALPVRQVRKVSTFHTQDAGGNNSSAMYPELRNLDCAAWADGMDVSNERLCGIQLTPSQLATLKGMEMSGQSLDTKTLDSWISAEPTEDKDWAVTHQNQPAWTWERVLHQLQLRYPHPEQAAKALKLR